MNELDPAVSLRNIETALRLVIVSECDDSWVDMKGAPPRELLMSRREEEVRRRKGVNPSGDLLEYAQFSDLCRIIAKNWDVFAEIFKSKKDFDVLIGVVEDVRNTVAHSRQLAVFESYLLAGISGRIRAQVAAYRGFQDGGVKFYPKIESVVDTFGNPGSEGPWGVENYGRVNVGDIIEFQASAFSAQEAALLWKVSPSDPTGVIIIPSDEDLPVVARGGDVSFQYEITEDNVGEDFQITIILTTDSKYHRYMEYPSKYDDSLTFGYSVNPPL